MYEQYEGQEVTLHAGSNMYIGVLKLNEEFAVLENAYCLNELVEAMRLLHFCHPLAKLLFPIDLEDLSRQLRSQNSELRNRQFTIPLEKIIAVGPAKTPRLKK